MSFTDACSNRSDGCIAVTAILLMMLMTSSVPVSASVMASASADTSTESPIAQERLDAPIGPGPGPDMMLGMSPVWNSSVSGSSQCVAWGDVDNDGDLDLAVGYAGSPLRLYTMDNGMLSTTPSWASNEKFDAVDIAFGDYDNDGDLDLAVGNFGGLPPQKNTLYRNENGTLTTSAVWTSNEAQNTMSVAWGDIDLDGDLDLVVGNGGKVQMYRSDDGALSEGSVWNSTNTYAAYGMALGDFDKDGDLDLAVSNNGNGANSIIRNAGGTFANYAFWNSTEWDNTKEVAWVDYDNDGDLDLSVANEYEPVLRLYRNDMGTITEYAVWNSTQPLTLKDMVWGDFDNDGDQDVATGNQANVTIFRNDAGVVTTTSVWNSTDACIGYSIAAGDFDMDKDIDLATAAISSNRLYRNEFSAFLGFASWSSDEAEATRAVAWGDYDNDGDLDLAVGNNGFGIYSHIYRNDNGVLTSSEVWNSSITEGVTSIAWVDYDSDGDLDLSTGSDSWSGWGHCRIYRNDNGNINTWAVWNTTEVRGTESMAWGDYDGDGDLDLAAANAGMWGEWNTLYRNDNGALTGYAVWNSTEADRSESVAWGDYDNDGDLDLAVGNVLSSGAGNNRIYRNDNGTLTNSSVWASAELEMTFVVKWGDYDNDGDLDLVAGNQNERISLYQNDGGTISTESVWNSVESSYTFDLEWADLDSDGDLDLIAGNVNAPNRVYRNNDGVLEPMAVWSAAATEATKALAVADYDKDGDLDIAIGTTGNPNKVYQNRVGTLMNRIPKVAIGAMNDHYKGDVRLNYTLYDPEGDFGSIVVYYSADGGLTWHPATEASGGDGLKRLSMGPAGMAHYFMWDSDKDKVNSSQCRFRVHVMDLPKVGLYQQIPFSTTPSDLTVTNFWPMYESGLYSVIVDEDIEWSVNLDGFFKDDDDPDTALTYTYNHSWLDPLDPKISIDPETHNASWTPRHGDPSIENLVFTASDPQGHTGRTMPVILFYHEVNEPPVYLGATNKSLELKDATVLEDDIWYVDLDDHFQDEERDEGIIFTSNSSDIAIDPVTHVAKWEPVHGSVSIIGLVFTARDADDPAMVVSSQPINLTYVEVNDQWPVFVGGLGDMLVYEDSTWSVDLDSVFYDEESNPQLYNGSLSFSCSHPQVDIDPETHTASWTPGHGNSTLFSIVFTAHDPLRPWRNATSPSITLYYVEVNDERPILLGDIPEESVVDEDSTWSVNLGLHFHDEESGSSLIYRSDSPVVTIDQVTHVASWTPVHGSKDLVVNLTAVDPQDLNWSVSVTIRLLYREVNDQPPVYIGGLGGGLVKEDTTWLVDLDDCFQDEEGASLAFKATHESVTIDNATHVATWTPLHGSPSLVALRFIASDGLFQIEAPPITLTYMEVNDRSPVYIGGLENVTKISQRVWKVDLDDYFTDEENPNTLIFTCNNNRVKIDPITHEAVWIPRNDDETTAKNLVFTAFDPEDRNQTVSSPPINIVVPEVISDYLIVLGPIGLTLLDTIAYGFSGLMFIVGIYVSTRAVRRTRAHRKKIEGMKSLRKLRTYYKKNIRPDIEKEKVSPVQALLLKDAVEERSIELKGGIGEEAGVEEDEELPKDAKTLPSSADLEKEEEGGDEEDDEEDNEEDEEEEDKEEKNEEEDEEEEKEEEDEDEEDKEEEKEDEDEEDKEEEKEDEDEEEEEQEKKDEEEEEEDEKDDDKEEKED